MNNMRTRDLLIRAWDLMMIRKAFGYVGATTRSCTSFSPSRSRKHGWGSSRTFCHVCGDCPVNMHRMGVLRRIRGAPNGVEYSARRRGAYTTQLRSLHMGLVRICGTKILKLNSISCSACCPTVRANERRHMRAFHLLFGLASSGVTPQ